MLHTKECLADAIICAAQNARDADSISDAGFDVLAHGPTLYDWAMEFLSNGLKTCICD